MVKGFVATAVALPLLFTLAGCGSGGAKSTANYYANGNSSSAHSTHPPAKMNRHGTTDASGMSSVRVEMNDYYFAPTVIEATPGQKLTLHFSNHGTVEHNVTIASQGISSNVPAHKTASIQVRFPSSGLVAFTCKYHKMLGMTGELRARQPAFTG